MLVCAASKLNSLDGTARSNALRIVVQQTKICERAQARISLSHHLYIDVEQIPHPAQQEGAKATIAIKQDAG